MLKLKFYVGHNVKVIIIIYKWLLAIKPTSQGLLCHAWVGNVTNKQLRRSSNRSLIYLALISLILWCFPYMFCDATVAATQFITYQSLTNLSARRLASPWAFLPSKFTFSLDRCFSMLIVRRGAEEHLDSAFSYFCRCNFCLISYTFGARLFHACMAWKGSFFSGRAWRVTRC